VNLTRSLLPFTFALAALLALAACGPAATQAAMPAASAPLMLSCPEQSQAFAAALDQHVTTWGQATDGLLHGQEFQPAIPMLLQSSQDLPALIERLRGIQEEVRRLNTLACVKQVRGAALGAMDSTIQLFYEIGTGQSDAVLQQSYAPAGQAWDSFGTLFAALKQPQKPLRQI